MRTIVQGYNSTKLLRQREEPPEAIPEEGGREEGESKISSALLLVFWGVKAKTSQLHFCGREGRWEGRHHPGFHLATEEMPPEGLWIIPLIEKGIEGGSSQLWELCECSWSRWSCTPWGAVPRLTHPLPPSGLPAGLLTATPNLASDDAKSQKQQQNQWEYPGRNHRVLDLLSAPSSLQVCTCTGQTSPGVTDRKDTRKEKTQRQAEWMRPKPSWTVLCHCLGVTLAHCPCQKPQEAPRLPLHSGFSLLFFITE